MRRLLVAPLVLFGMASASAAADLSPPVRDMPVLNPNPSAEHCPPISRYEAAKRGGKLKPDLLTELPTADLYKAVYRRIGGCIAPIIAAYGIGAPAAQSAGPQR
jgi:hypothetical protein